LQYFYQLRLQSVEAVVFGAPGKVKVHWSAAYTGAFVTRTRTGGVSPGGQ
jgi:hypothetical protein